MLESSDFMDHWKEFVDPSFEAHGLRELFETLTQPTACKDSKMTLIAGDASDRKFYRYQSDDFLAICMQFPKWEGGYGGDPMSWLGMQAALAKMGLPVPRVLSVDEANKCIWTEDFGQDFLNCHMSTSVLADNVAACSETLELYDQALELLVTAQYPTETAPNHPAMSRSFDFEKLHYEMKFFVKHFLCSFLKLTEGDPWIAKISSEFISLCQWLSDRPRVLCHRDYHVRNVMVVAGKAKWIDFQDARMGPHTYDVVSLLRDSYVELETSTRDRLALRYLELANSRRSELKLPKMDLEDYWIEFQSMGLQRNIKALGSFGYLAMEKNKPDYLKYVNNTLITILNQAKDHGQIRLNLTYPALHELMGELLSGCFKSLVSQRGNEIKGLKT